MQAKPLREQRDPSVDPWYQQEEEVFVDAPEQREELSDAAIERRYDHGTARIVTQRNDFLIPNLLDSMDQEMYINLNPPYQRRLRWDRKRKSRLIESLIMNVPIPPVFLFETDLAQYEVMDGQQRLATIREFFNNELELTGLEEWSALNGRRYNQLPGRIQGALKRRSLAAVILLVESESDIKRFVFERLNSGGVRLNPQELRNSVSAGPFNDLLHELSRSELFTRIWQIPPKEREEETSPSQKLAKNRFYRQMLDCEIVLRFFTLSEPELLRTSMRVSLDNTMKRYAERTPDVEPLRTWFMECLSTAHAIYGEQTFRLPEVHPRRTRPTLSRGLYDAVMLGLLMIMRGEEDWGRKREELASRRGRIVALTNEIMSDARNYGLLVGRLNTRSSVLERINLMASVFEETLGSPA